MFRSFDLWFKCFKKLVIATIPDPNKLNEADNVFIPTRLGRTLWE